jgi:hypothetical protein
VTTPFPFQLGDGWMATTTFSLGVHSTEGRVRRALVTFTHELGGRAVAAYRTPLHVEDWQLTEAHAWTVCIDPACLAVRRYAHTLSEPRRISGDELRLLATDDVALTL